MAVILVLDKVPRPGRKLPTIRKIVCDGFLLYSEDQKSAVVEGAGKVQPKLIAQAMIDNRRPGNVGEPIYHELREELARLAAEQKAEQQRKKWQEAENNGPTRGDSHD